jgi:hypothetical protein
MRNVHSGKSSLPSEISRHRSRKHLRPRRACLWASEEVFANHRSCRCNCRILIPRIAVAVRKNFRQEVRASKCRSGELSTMASKKSPHAPKWRNIEVKPWPRRGVACWRKMFDTNPLYPLCWAAFGSNRSSSGSYDLRFSDRLRVEGSASGAAPIRATPKRVTLG